MERKNAPIAVFDSGVGGISVLRELVQLMPNENYIYLGDSANAPYGTRPVEEIRALTLANVAVLLEQGAKALVVACNTATSAAVRILRGMYPDLPIVGIEPALKPAALHHPGGCIAVLATKMTLRQEKFAALLEHYRSQAGIIPVPASELVEYVERGELDSPALFALVKHILATHLDTPADAIVLGCTHFPFVRPVIERAAPHTVIYDGGNGTAREARRQLSVMGLINPSSEPGSIEIQNSSGSPEKIMLCYQLLDS